MANKFGANIALQTLMLFMEILFEIYEYCSYAFRAAMPEARNEAVEGKRLARPRWRKRSVLVGSQ